MSNVNPKTYLFIAVILCLFCQAVQAQSGRPGAAAGKAASDTARVYPKKLPAKNTWEKIVSFPGTIAFLPFKLLFSGTNALVIYAQEAESLAGLRRLLASRTRDRGVIPAFSRRSGIGLKYYANNLLGDGSRLTVNVKHGIIDNRQKHYVRMRRIRLGKNFSADALLQYRILARESFFGLGPESDFDAVSSYTHEKTTALANIGRQFGAASIVQIFAQFEQNNIFAGQDPDEPSLTLVPPDSVPGLGTKIKIWTLGAALRVDTRNSLATPTAGWELSAAASASGQINGDRFRFWTLRADVRKYIHLFYGRTLLFRLSGQRVRPLGSREIPFYYLSELGRRESIRGFTRGRFRDRDLLILSAEYRYPIWHFFEAVLFADAGQVAPSAAKFALDQFKYGLGGGMRIHSRTGLILKLEIGVGTNRTRLIGVLNE